MRVAAPAVARLRADLDRVRAGRGPSGSADAGETGDPTGHNPGGGMTIAEWRDDALWVYLGNTNAGTCEYAFDLPDCGPPEHAVWAIGFGIPLELLPQGEWTEDELWWQGVVHRALPPVGDCSSSGGAIGSVSLVRVDAAGEEIVSGTIEGLVPDESDGIAYSGPFEAVVCE